MPTPLTPEQEARRQIDRMLEAAGWQVQSRERLNRTAAAGVAVCEFPTTTGPVDYLLFAQGRPIGVVEAKRAGTTLSGVEPQAWRYAANLPEPLAALAWHEPLPFHYKSTGVETYVSDDRGPKARSRRVYTFLRPETLARWAADAPLVGAQRSVGPIGEAGRAYGAATLTSRLRHLPPLNPGTLWPAQVRAIRNLERSLAEVRPRALTVPHRDRYDMIEHWPTGKHRTICRHHNGSGDHRRSRWHRPEPEGAACCAPTLIR